jgi:hypothetical protein
LGMAAASQHVPLCPQHTWCHQSHIEAFSTRVPGEFPALHHSILDTVRENHEQPMKHGVTLKSFLFISPSSLVHQQAKGKISANTPLDSSCYHSAAAFGTAVWFQKPANLCRLLDFTKKSVLRTDKFYLVPLWWLQSARVQAVLMWWRCSKRKVLSKMLQT